MKKSILIVAGGTGGHIAPGIALAEEFKKRNENVVFLSLERNRQYGDFQRADFPVAFYNAPSLSGSFKKKLLFPFLLAASFFSVMRIVRKYNVYASVCMGGYSTIPAILYFIVFRLPYHLCEQNAVPGKVTKLFAKFAENIFMNFPDGTGKLDRYENKMHMTGNPVRASILKEAEVQNTRKKKTLSILVLGGSQGAVQLNEMSLAAIPHLKDVEWTIQCGEKNIDAMQSQLKENSIEGITLFGFHSDIHTFYRNADILVCRAGAGVLSEGCIFSLPMILIPYPYAADDHQKQNALYLEKNGAAFVISTKDREPENLIQCITRIQNDEKLLQSMRNASKNCAKKDASKLIAEKILE